MRLSSVKERQKRHWDTVAPRLGAWAEWAERNLQPMTSWLQQLTGWPVQARVLDVACGAGYPALVLAWAGGRVLAADLSRQMIGVASERARRERLGNIRFVQMDAEAVCFADSSFDIVTNIYSLMFCLDPQRVVSEAHRLLVPGGRLAVATWAHPSQESVFWSDPRGGGGVCAATRGAIEGTRAISPRLDRSPLFSARASGIHEDRSRTGANDVRMRLGARVLPDLHGHRVASAGRRTPGKYG